MTEHQMNSKSGQARKPDAIDTKTVEFLKPAKVADNGLPYNPGRWMN